MQLGWGGRYVQFWYVASCPFRRLQVLAESSATLDRGLKGEAFLRPSRYPQAEGAIKLPSSLTKRRACSRMLISRSSFHSVSALPGVKGKLSPL